MEQVVAVALHHLPHHDDEISSYSEIKKILKNNHDKAQKLVKYIISILIQHESCLFFYAHFPQTPKVKNFDQT